MAKQVTLAAQPRAADGKKEARRVRRQGRVPAVMYGHGVEPTTVSVDARELYHVLHTSAGLNALIRLTMDGEEHLTMPREVQRHPVRGELTHVDFVAIDRDREIHVEVPVHVVGAEEVKVGVVAVALHTVPVRVRPFDVPDFVEVDVSSLEIGDSLRVSDLRLDAGVIEADPEDVVVSVATPTELAVVEEEAAETIEGEEQVGGEADTEAAAAADAAGEGS